MSAFSGKDKCTVLPEYISSKQAVYCFVSHLLLMDILMALAVYCFPDSLVPLPRERKTR